LEVSIVLTSPEKTNGETIAIAKTNGTDRDHIIGTSEECKSRPA